MRAALQQEESHELSVSGALCYLVLATVGLLVLYGFAKYHARYVVFFMLGIFSLIGCIVATQLGTHPLLQYLAPSWENRQVTIPYVCTTTVAHACAAAISGWLVC